MSCVVRWWDVLFVKGMRFSSKMHVFLFIGLFQTNSEILQQISVKISIYYMVLRIEPASFTT